MDMCLTCFGMGFLNVFDMFDLNGASRETGRKEAQSCFKAATLHHFRFNFAFRAWLWHLKELLYIIAEVGVLETSPKIDLVFHQLGSIIGRPLYYSSTAKGYVIPSSPSVRAVVRGHAATILDADLDRTWVGGCRWHRETAGGRP